MPRGRKVIPDEIKALKGNPGHRKLHLQHAAQGKPAAALDEHGISKLEYPDWLTTEPERELFRSVLVDILQRRIARSEDLAGYARWATYLARWVHCKLTLDNKSTWIEVKTTRGPVMKRHPYWRDMMDLERLLVMLEDRLALSPVARQAVVRGLIAASLVQIPEAPDERADVPPPADLDTMLPADPLGFMNDTKH